MNILGLEITKANGDLNWVDLRRFMYVALFVWVVGIRFLGLNIFDDFTRSQGVGLDTLFDTLALYALWVFTWHIVYPARPRL